jgi:pyruvate/2-oxoglutarate dehydrogenase complex dihydrolipoamide acyltransferase (E2) component
MEKITRYRLATFFVVGNDPITGNEIRYPRTATTGMTVTSDSPPEEGANPNTLYDVPESEIKRVEAIGIAAGDPVFYSDAEIEAAAMAILDAADEDEEGGALPPTPSTPTSFANMSVSEIADYITTAEPSADELLAILESAPAATREELGNKILAAEAEASGGDPRDDVIHGVAEALGRGSGVGPEGSEGVPGTEGSDEDPAGSSKESPGQTPAPTDAATALAASENVDLALITGTGTKGRVTEADVKKYLAEKGD